MYIDRKIPESKILMPEKYFVGRPIPVSSQFLIKELNDIETNFK